jgi:hypothetical protein
MNYLALEYQSCPSIMVFLKNNLICIYLSHPKFNYDFLFASKIDTLYFFYLKFLVLEVVKNNEDVQH